MDKHNISAHIPFLAFDSFITIIRHLTLLPGPRFVLKYFITLFMQSSPARRQYFIITFNISKKKRAEL